MIMIHYAKGDLLKSDAEALVNTVNTVGVMGKGIALQFKEQFPQNYLLYRQACKEKKVKIGEMFITVEQRLNGNKTIINFPTKTTWRKPSEYSYIQMGLESLHAEIIRRNIKSIAIPPLGSHNGGLDWLKVKEMIVEKLKDLNCDIYLYTPDDKIIENSRPVKVKLSPSSAMMLDVLCDMIAYGEFISVFAAEKIVYFLQRLGAQNVYKINFIPYYYGPYSKGRIGHFLYYLNGNFVKGMGGMYPKPFDQIWLMPNTKFETNIFLTAEENIKYKEIAERTKEFLRGYYSYYSLELLATVDYILNDNPRLRKWKIMDNQVVLKLVSEDIKSWSKRKDKLFSKSSFLPQIIDHLRLL